VGRCARQAALGKKAESLDAARGAAEGRVAALTEALANKAAEMADAVFRLKDVRRRGGGGGGRGAGGWGGSRRRGQGAGVVQRAGAEACVGGVRAAVQEAATQREQLLRSAAADREAAAAALAELQAELQGRLADQAAGAEERFGQLDAAYRELRARCGPRPRAGTSRGSWAGPRPARLVCLAAERAAGPRPAGGTRASPARRTWRASRSWRRT
jgi:hypothetical protein